MTPLTVRCGFQYVTGFDVQADFQVGPGITAISGPSGSGKSTLVALIAGLLRPATGEVRFAGRTFVDCAAGRWLPPQRRRVGVAFQEPRLFPHLRVRGNLLYGRRRFRTLTPRFEVLVDALELGPLLDRRPEALSGGQRQRVALGRALLTGAELLLIDEPVSALDAPLRGRVLDFVRDTVAAAGRTCLVVCHEEQTATRLASAARIHVHAGHAVLHG